MADKERLDIILVKRGLCLSRETAKAVIMSGCVYVNGQKLDKAGTGVHIDSDIEVKVDKPKYVSRGGLKLEKAITMFNICLSKKTCIDIGASTGGFTDCMLQNGALSVIAVDVGYGQLDWKLRNDKRVTVLEKTNARYLNLNVIKTLLDFASVDVSFISLEKILPIFNDVLSTDGEAICLIKPQFECGRKYVGKKGVVKEKFVHVYVINKVMEYGALNSLFVKNITHSPIKGPNGNIEYLIHFAKVWSNFNKCVDDVVDKAHTELERAEHVL